MKHRVVLCTGGFDPLHSGHIEYLRCAKALGDTLIVGLNSDDWLSRKKGQEFLPFYEREQMVVDRLHQKDFSPGGTHRGVTLES